MENQMLTLLKTRRSVRKYLPTPVEPEKLDAILEAGTYAPSGMNRQTPVIVAVQDGEERKAVQALNCQARGGAGDPYYGAPHILLVLADPRESNTWVEDGACTLHALMQAAHALGVSTCWIHGDREMFRLPEGKALLEKWGLPSYLEGVGSVAIGYGDGPLPEAKPRKAGYIVKI